MTSPPRPEKRPHVHTEHGVSREDPYYWLRDREDPAVLAHLQAENAWTEAALAHQAPLRKLLYEEMLGRVQETDVSVPAPWGPWVYYARTEQGRAYPIHCRRPREGGDEQVMLDANELAPPGSYLGMGMVEVSPDHRWLAYAIDLTGGERYTIRVRDLATGKDTGEEITGVSAMVLWANDSRTLWWCELDATMRTWRVCRRKLGSETTPSVVYEEHDEKFRLFIRSLRSGRFLAIEIGNQSTTETRLVPADRPHEVPIVVEARRQGVKYHVSQAGDSLFVLTDLGEDGRPGSAVNKRLLQRPVLADGISFGPPTERIAHREHAELLRADGFSTHLVVYEREQGQIGLRVLGAADRSDRTVTLPERPSVLGAGLNLEYDARVFRYSLESMTTPPTVMELDIASLASTRLREKPVPTYDRTRYRSERREAVAADGQRVPISLVYRSDLDLQAGPHPTVLYGYGSYGITIDPQFSLSRPSLLDRGVIFAIAHVRGGSFLGRSWYEQGKFEHKPNTFSDFVAAARALVDSGLTSPQRLAMWGGSAGGLLVGAVANQAPELFRAVVAEVPFVDVVTTILDDSLPLSILEWEEWGNPKDPKFFEIMLGYSPYDNVRAQPYPDIFAVAGFHDPRVQYWEPAKWIARLRDRATGGEFLLKTHLGAGHQGVSGRYGELEERAVIYAWLLDKLGATEKLQ
jgi:oligopeptidase B